MMYAYNNSHKAKPMEGWGCALRGEGQKPADIPSIDLKAMKAGATPLWVLEGVWDQLGQVLP